MRLTRLTSVLFGLSLLAAVLPASAFPAPAALTTTRTADGLLPKIRYPKINVGKGAKKVGKSVVKVGAGAVKGAEKGAEIYEAGRSLSSKANGTPGLPHLK